MSIFQNRNILFIQTDAQHYCWLGCLGAPGLHTPNLDRLAKEKAVTFDHAYTCAAVCVPSRTSLITGRYSLGHGVTSNEVVKLADDEPRIGRLLQGAGQSTGYFGKTHFANGERSMTDEGWQHSFTTKEYNPYLQEQSINARYPERDAIDRFPLRYWKVGNSRIPKEHYLENVITDKALVFIDQNKEKPFSCFVNYVAPHSPFTPPKEYTDLYKPEDMVLPQRFDNELEGKPPATRRWIEQNQKYLNDDELRHWLVSVYGLVTMVDENVGRLIDKLEEHNLMDNTLVVFTSDHGDFAARYGILGKSWTLTDDLVRVPLLISMSGVKPRTEQSLVQNIDLNATMLQWAGARQPKITHGKSLLPLLQGNVQTHRESVFAYDQAEYSLDKLYVSMIRTQRWKYIGSTGFHGELYDMQNDPQETRNLDQDPNYQQIRNELRDRLLQWHIDNTGGFHDADNATYWIDETQFFDKDVFSGQRLESAKPDKLFNRI